MKPVDNSFGGVMDKRTKEALEASIKHWKHMRDMRKPGTSDKNRPYGNGCPLCAAFMGNLEGTCVGCPVMEKTGFRLCSASPWYEASVAFEDWECGGSRKAWQAAADEEIAFLESLREPE